MTTDAGQNASAPLRDAYHVFDENLRLRQARLGYLMSLILMPAGVTLDFFVYPELKWPALKARLLCDLALLPGFLLAFTPLGQRHVRALDKPCAVLPILSICWMIYASEGVVSPYYAGLSLVMVAVCLLMPYTLREGALFCSFVMAGYAGACLLHRIVPPAYISQRPQTELASTLYNNLYFLGLTSIIATTACHLSSARRFSDFSLRHDLDVNNHQLETTLHKLQATEVQLVQSEKMNALGKLSAGLLHEINNPLNFTFMALQVAEQEAAENAGLKETLQDIGQGMTRIRSVISDLRAFAYPSKLQSGEPFKIEEALTTALRLTAHELAEIPVQQVGLSDVWAAGVKTQVVHVFMNLLVNSAHALRAKSLGRPAQITISTETREGRRFIHVRDNGTGVRAADLPRLFEPFFTTKEPGQGTGLGLSICHTIVSNHGGKMSVASEEGQWTQVTFDLPAADAPGSKS